jgi:hypothetical protein
MDFSIRLRTAEDDLAEKRAALMQLVTPAKAGRQDREPKAATRRAVKLIHVPAAHGEVRATEQTESRHGNR